MTDQSQHLTRSDASRLGRRRLVQLGAATAGALLLGRSQPVDAVASMAGTDGGSRTPGPAAVGADVALAWFDLAGTLVRTTPGFSPPVAARMFGYAGVTLYESLVDGMRDHRSLAGQLDGLHVPPAPAGHRSRRLHWPLVANAALAAALRGLFPAGAATDEIDELERTLLDRFAERVDRDVLDESHRHGRHVAAVVLEWAATDGGHDGHLRNFPDTYRPTTGPGSWVPTPPAHSPALQPRWGSNRTMLPGLVDVTASRPPVPYSEDPSSPFYAEAYEVYETTNELTPEQLDIARFWSDDPGATATPAGHSVSILSQVLAGRGASLEVAAAAYAKVGIALSDAFVCCWATKFRHNVLRPITYIRAHIEPTWGDQLPLTTPPFPEYTSGHSVQSGALARVLTDLFGPMPVADNTHVDRGFAARRFTSFDEAAEEAAVSRLFGGIHYRSAIDEGLRQGRLIGDTVNRLHLTG